MELKGQLSIWDLEITEKPTLVTKTEKKITETEVVFTKSLKKSESKKNEKSIKFLELTKEQQKFLNENDVMKNENLSRIIMYSGGGVGIETKEGNQFRTIYINKEGKEEFKFNKKSPVLPMDKILYYKIKTIEPNEIQNHSLKEILSNKKTEVKYVIHRKGDENILIQLKDKVMSIIPRGWVLEFNDVQALYDEQDIECKDSPKDIKEMQKRVKVGDIVEASIGKEKLLVQGEVTRIYGMGNVILNIIFDNEKKHTAIGRHAVRRIIKCA